MNHLRLLRLLRPAVARKSRLFSNPFFEDPFYASDFFPPTSSQFTQEYIRDLKEEVERLTLANEKMNSVLNQSRSGVTETKATSNVIDEAEKKSATDAASATSSDHKVEATNRASDGTVSATASDTQPASSTKDDHHMDDFDLLAFFLGRERNDTYERAKKLLEQASDNSGVQKPSLTLEDTDDLLKGRNDFSHLFGGLGGGKGATVSGSSYESSTIFRNGKAITVSKHSVLNPNGTIRTEVNQEYVDGDGQKDARKWIKEDDFRREKIEESKQENKERVQEPISSA